MLIRRLNEKPTSAEVSGVPSENFDVGAQLESKRLGVREAVYELATRATGVAESEPLK